MLISRTGKCSLAYELAVQNIEHHSKSRLFLSVNLRGSAINALFAGYFFTHKYGDYTINMAGIQLTLYPEFGCVVFDIVISWFVLMWMGVKVAQARRKYDVKVSS